jgi:exodeoxyribonuclease V alpha subunit
MSLSTPLATPDTPQEHLAGSVERVTFHSEETGFCVLCVKVRGHRDLVTVVGTAPTITPGEYIESDGWWITDRTHGLQFKAIQLRVVPPTTQEGIERYLGSGMVKGIGPHFARKLVQAFGAEVFDVIEQTRKRLQGLDGIGPKRAARVVAAWADRQEAPSLEGGVAPRAAAQGDRPRTTQRPWRVRLRPTAVGSRQREEPVLPGIDG